MNIKAIAHAELAKIVAAHVGVVVSVVVNGNTVACVTDSTAGESTLGERGETGLKSGRVWGNADSIGTLTVGELITVDGTEATVTRYDVDPAGALAMLEYIERKPI